MDVSQLYLSLLTSSSPTFVTMPITSALPIKKALFESDTPSRRVWLSGNIFKRSSSSGINLRYLPVWNQRWNCPKCKHSGYFGRRTFWYEFNQWINQYYRYWFYIHAEAICLQSDIFKPMERRPWSWITMPYLQ